MLEITSIMSPKHTKDAWIAFVSTYPPRECGIATFTQDLVTAFDQLFYPSEESKIVALNRRNSPDLDYPKKVIATVCDDQKEDYISAAEALNNTPEVKLVSLQHEFGIFGGKDGEYVVDFLKNLRKPATVTFHTALPDPNPHMREVVRQIADNVELLIVMTESSKNVYVKYYDINPDKIVVIPHGIHPLSYTDGLDEKKKFGLEGKTVLSTFGFLGPGKGIEYAIDAVAEVVKKDKNIVYLILGATHPIVLQEKGDEYRKMLEEKVKKYGIEENVKFVNKYLDLSELLDYLKATNIYLSVSQNPHQAVSGTLSYALGSGRAVVSTPFAQAKEYITNEVGELAEFGESKKMAQSLLRLVGDLKLASEMGKNAYFRTRGFTWRNVALSYMRNYKKLLPELVSRERNLPPIDFSHMGRMTDDFGIFQFAKLTEPDPRWGYTLDDNARALLVVAQHYSKNKDAHSLELASIYMSFLEYVAIPDGGFHNYVTYDRKYHDERNSVENLEDANARGFFALATVATSKTLPSDLRERAKKMFENHIEAIGDLKSPRALAFYIKAFAIWLTEYNCEKSEDKIRSYADKLCDLYYHHARDNWHWFEEVLTYSNGVLPEALLWVYEYTGKDQYLKVAKESLDFLIAYSFDGDLCVPIGQSGWLRKGEEKKLFDQQPEEVSALVLAIRKMYDITKEDSYKNKMLQAFDWFLGENILGQVVYDQATGGCYDGIGENYINLNQGAESTIMYLLARLAVDI